MTSSMSPSLLPNVALLTAKRRPPPSHQTKDQRPPPSIVNHLPEWEVEDIIAHRLVRNKTHYLVKWLGYPDESNSWEPASNLLNSSEAISVYHRRVKDQRKEGGANVRVPPTPARVPASGNAAGRRRGRRRTIRPARRGLKPSRGLNPDLSRRLQKRRERLDTPELPAGCRSASRWLTQALTMARQPIRWGQPAFSCWHGPASQALGARCAPAPNPLTNH